MDAISEGEGDDDGGTGALRLLVTIPEAAEALAIGRTTVYELIGAGDLEVVHIGRSVRVPVAALSEFVARRRVGVGGYGAGSNGEGGAKR